jgi:hypothetical protein
MRISNWSHWLTAMGFAVGVVLMIYPVSPYGRPQQVSATPASPAGTVRFCVLFGAEGKTAARWDGSIRATGARILALDGWRLAPGNRVEGTNWKITSDQPDRPGSLVENGVVVTAELTTPDSRFEVKTLQGEFSFSVEEVGFGPGKSFLDGRAIVERLPFTTQLTSSPEEQDHPAITQSSDAVYVAYVEFTHGDRSQKWPRQLKEKPASYDPLARPTGGDRVLLMEYSKSGRKWGKPEPVSAAQQDVYGVAAAVDGTGRLWVIWSENVDGNFDLYARARKGDTWSREVRLTTDPAPDLQPAAATDTTGAVWIAWQGYRGDNFDVLAVRQQDGAFGAEQKVSFSSANDWDPQIAAGKDGRVAVVWDTYDKGNYDVYLRHLRYSGKISAEDPLPIAASQKFEARPSVTCDAEGRMWVAYEEQYRRWGKDFGAYETTGSGLYQPGNIRVRILDGSRYFETAADLGKVLDNDPYTQPRSQGRTRFPPNEPPNPELAGKRPPGDTPYEQSRYKSIGYPRLTADENGGVYLAYRSYAPGSTPLGSVYFENLAFFDGAQWRGPIFVPQSDGTLDIRPALLAVGPSRLLMAGSADHRFSTDPRDRTVRFAGDRHGDRAPTPSQRLDPFNYDIFVTELITGTKARRGMLTEIPREKPAPPESDAEPEKQQVAMMRQYRAKLGAEMLRLLRGEFHRHTVISADTDYRDASLIDAWRYALDAASMDWIGCCDHDNGFGREYTWWTMQKLTDAFHVPGRFVPMFSFERSVRYPEGHRNVIFAKRGIRVLPRLPRMAPDSPADPAPDTQMLYEYLRRFDGVTAVHTSATEMGTDWRNNDPEVEPAVEIYQGDRQNYEMPEAPRSNSADDSIGRWRPLGFVSRALEKGYRLGFEASSDHFSTHMSYCNVWVTELTREAVLHAFKKRRIYGATDNILADVRANGHFMGEEFETDESPNIHVKLAGTADFAKVHVIKDGKYVYTAEPHSRTVEFSWRDNAVVRDRTSYYYVRGEQVDGELVWVSPMWITVRR